MPQVVLVGPSSGWPSEWRLAPYDLRSVEELAHLGSASLVDCVVIVPEDFEQALGMARSVDEFRGDGVIAKVLACGSEMPGLDRLLSEHDFDGCIDTAWPEPLAQAAIAMALRHVEMGRNIVEIQRVVLAQSRHETAALRELAGHDELTHLYNRRYFTEAVAREHDRSRRQERPYSLVFVDMDDLKQLNSQWGHAGGSRALRELATLLSASVRASDLAARIGGDEFVVFLDNCDEKGALEFATRFCERVKEHVFDVDGCPVSMSISAGVASFPEHGRTHTELLNHADEALYAAKARGKGKAVTFVSAYDHARESAVPSPSHAS